MMPAIQSTQKIQEESGSRSFGWLKIMLLGVFASAGTLGAAGYFTRFLGTGELGYFWGVILAASIALLCAALEAVFVKKQSTLFLLALIQSAAPLILFLRILPKTNAFSFLLTGAGLLFFFSWIGLFRGAINAKNGLTIRFFAIAREAVGKTATGMILFLTILMYGTYFAWGAFNETLGKKISDNIVLSADPLIEVWYEGASVNDTLDEFLAKVTETEIRKLKTRAAIQGKLELNFDLLPPEERARAIAEITAREKAELEKRIGPVNGKATVKDTLYEIARNELQKLAEKENGKELLGLGAAILLFGFFKSFTFLTNWLVELLAFLVYKLLLTLGFAEITYESANKETVSL